MTRKSYVESAVRDARTVVDSAMTREEYYRRMEHATRNMNADPIRPRKAMRVEL